MIAVEVRKSSFALKEYYNVCFYGGVGWLVVLGLTAL